MEVQKLDFFTFLLDNECDFKDNDLFTPFLIHCIDDVNLFNIKSHEQIFAYLWVNGFSESVIMAFLRLWAVFERFCELNHVIPDKSP
jgi:hypothetical protein